jgi:hypothetical protein
MPAPRATEVEGHIRAAVPFARFPGVDAVHSRYRTCSLQPFERRDARVNRRCLGDFLFLNEDQPEKVRSALSLSGNFEQPSMKSMAWH